MHPHDVLRLGAGGVAVIVIGVAVLGRRGSRQRTRAALGAGQTALTTLLMIWAGSCRIAELDSGAVKTIPWAEFL
jgi:hypothetical protein